MRARDFVAAAEEIADGLMAVVGGAEAPLDDDAFVVAGDVFIAANDETDCGFEATEGDDNMFVIRTREATVVVLATESAFDSVSAVDDGVEDDADVVVVVGCGDWVFTQSRLFVPDPDILSLGAQYEQ